MYSELINRNIGLLTPEQQEVLHKSSMAVFGLGGLGGVICEVLCRSGVGALKIIDHDKFEPTNLNRQVFAYTDTLGQMKTDVTEQFLKKINPEIRIDKYNAVLKENVELIIKDTKVAILAIDNVKPCIMLSRAARKMDVPLVEGWAIPYANVRVFTKNTPSLEEVYGLPTAGRDIDTITSDELNSLKVYVLSTLKNIKGVGEFYSPLAIDRIMKGEITSFAPIVWLTAVMMALEAIKVVLKWGQPALSPNFALYDPFKHELPRS